MQKSIILITERKKNYFLRIICFLVVFLYMAGMFYFSSQNGIQSNKISGEIVTEIKQHVTLPPELVEKNFIIGIDLNLILRKLTHFSEYFILVLIVYLTLRICYVRHNTTSLITFTFCVVYASLDEYHQSFIMGRTPALRDIFIDVSGGALALVFLFLLKKINYKIKKGY